LKIETPAARARVAKVWRSCEIYLERWGADVADSTRRTLAEWLAPARETFGAWTLRPSPSGVAGYWAGDVAGERRDGP
jgi:hypothetical protein